jgi:OOP family OmpA-OmpF porin
MKKRALGIVLLVWCLIPNPLMAAEKQDVLDIASGAVVISATSEYNESWAALMFLNGTPDTGWCSAENKAYPNTIIMELSRQFQLTEFVIDNTKTQESGYPGISARKFELYASTTSHEAGFDLLYTGEAAKGERKVFSLKKSVKAQWLKLVVLSNWGHPAYTEIMELEAYGKAVGAPPQQRLIKGVFDTNYRLLRLEQYGNTIEGCYDWGNGTLSGTTDGRVIRFQWTENGPKTGTAVMVLTVDGNFLNGMWYENGTYRGLWYGTKVTDGRQPQCETKKDAIGSSLDAMGRAIVYGIYFDFDSATLQPESTETLEQILQAIQSRPSLKLTIEGHTDSQGSNEYNLKLSQRRAQAVVDWLVQKGIEASRLEAKGYGESRPVADNSRPDGRALNRRVEIAVAK